ncbi:MAG TPA: hypothetical protein VNS08_17255 [Ureibacillus sp.]|nr:hypothetical protein [Ureibacillus sp.]
MKRTELIKFRCTKEEKLLLLIMSKRMSEEKQENIPYSEVMRIALCEMAIKEFGKEKVMRVLEKGEPV